MPSYNTSVLSVTTQYTIPTTTTTTKKEAKSSSILTFKKSAANVHYKGIGEVLCIHTYT